MLKSVLEIAVRAGEATLGFYQGDFSVEIKGDDSPLTSADRASHECIVAGLLGLPEVLPILSEESSPEEVSERESWSRYWLVDPLDGTKEFIKGSGEYTVNIALIEDGRSVLGVVHQPVTGVSFVAAKGSGARRIEGKNDQVIRVRDADPQAVRLVLSASHASEALLAYLAARPAWDVHRAGSSLKFCLVASGAADLYPRLGPTMEWDTGAAQCVVEEAGGQVLDLTGNPLRYSKPSLVNPGLVTVGDPSLEWREIVSAAQGTD